ncbi:hypothetical protein MAL08_02305 [Leptospira noguchii]|uniref:hypothetical protein n=1 Tax=Leptospira noguchii TaxID=28182 RepID=UPI001FB7B1AB|nr:hypothetical protein [Leptospira noguchii]UOG38207.1 hypothetical protein MAL08_02305 [Leptospira noguchii]
MLRSVESSIEFEKFRRNWSENEQLSVSLLWSLEVNSASRSPNSAKRFLRKRFRSFEVNSASHSPWVV